MFGAVDVERVRSRLFVLVLVGLFIAAGCLALSDPPDSPWTTALFDGNDGDGGADGAVDTGPLERDGGIPSSTRSRLTIAPPDAKRSYSTTPHDKRAPPVLVKLRR
jgi:hypothetical protein